MSMSGDCSPLKTTARSGCGALSAIPRSFDFPVRNARNQRGFVIGEPLIPLWSDTNLLHREILEREKQVSQVSPDQFDLVVREVDLDRFTLRTDQEPQQ